jgi:hypothetical protein
MPFPPVRRVNIYALTGLCFRPTFETATARKHEPVHAIEIDDCQFEVFFWSRILCKLDL